MSNTKKNPVRVAAGLKATETRRANLIKKREKTRKITMDKLASSRKLSESNKIREAVGLHVGLGNVISQKLHTFYQELKQLTDALDVYPTGRMVDQIRSSISYKVAGGLVYAGNEALIKLGEMDQSLADRQERNGEVERSEKEAAFYKRQLQLHESLPHLVHWLCTPSDGRLMLEVLPFQDMVIKMLERNTSARDFKALREQIKGKYFDFKNKVPNQQLLEEKMEDMQFTWDMSGITVPESKKKEMAIESMVDELRYDIRDAHDKFITYRATQGSISSMWRRVIFPILEDKARDVHEYQYHAIGEEFHDIGYVPSYVLAKAASKAMDALYQAADDMTRDGRGRTRLNPRTGRPTYRENLSRAQQTQAKALAEGFKWSLLNEIKPLASEIERLAEEEREIGLQDSGQEDMRALMDKLREFE